jgi:cardiolipin synthase
VRFDGRAPRALLAFLLLLVVGCQTRGAVPMDSASLSPGAPSVRLFTEPEAGVQPVVQFIDAAQRSLDVAMYLLSNRSILTALASAQRRQVRVRVMLEEHPFGTGPGNQRSFAQLQAAGVAVAWGPPPFEFSHEKYAVSDGEVALVGTANWTAAAFASNREYLVEDRNATDVRQLSALFAADWGRSAPAVDDANLVVSPTNSRARLLALIQGARQQVSVE